MKKTEPKYVNFDIDSWNNGGPAIVSYNRGQVLIFRLLYGGERGGDNVYRTDLQTNTNMSKCVLILFVFLIEKTADIKSNKYRIN